MAGGELGLDITELRLGPPGAEGGGGTKRAFSQVAAAASAEDENSTSEETGERAKSRAVGWPPVCSYRQKHRPAVPEKKNVAAEKVKVSMDGAPYMRKIDLNAYQGYTVLSAGLNQLFGSFEIGKDSECSEFVAIYEDREGDWMLVGDVPWRMFMESCKRLRIMKSSEAMGLQKSSRGGLVQKT